LLAWQIRLDGMLRRMTSLPPPPRSLECNPDPPPPTGPVKPPRNWLNILFDILINAPVCRQQRALATFG
jgi:hypothetical protein